MCPAVPTTTDFMLWPRAVALRLPFGPSLWFLPFAASRSRLSVRLVLGPRFAATRSSFALTHPLQDVDQTEVDLPRLHVDANHLYAHLVAEPIHLLGVLTSQHVRPLDEPVVVVRHRGHV